MRKNYNLLIGEPTAELIKIQIGSAAPVGEEREMEVKGRDLVSGIPKIVRVHSSEIREAVQEPIQQIVDAVRRCLEITPPELASDIVDRGRQTGGALILGLDVRCSRRRACHSSRRRPDTAWFADRPNPRDGEIPQTPLTTSGTRWGRPLGIPPTAVFIGACWCPRGDGDSRTDSGALRACTSPDIARAAVTRQRVRAPLRSCRYSRRDQRILPPRATSPRAAQ